MRGDYFRRVFLAQAVYMLPVALSWSFVFLALYRSGFSLVDIILFKLVDYLASAAALLVTRRYVVHRSMLIGFFGFAFVLAAIPYAHSLTSLLIIAVVDGFTFLHFWVPYNTIYFRFCGGRRAYMAGLMLLVPPLLYTIGPLLGGIILDELGVTTLFLTGALVAAAGGLVYFCGLRLGEIEVSLGSAWQAGAGLRSITFIQGFWQAADWVCVPIVTLYFFTSGFSYGGFLSVIAVFGAFSTLHLCRRSDERGSRSEYLYPSILMAALATIMCAFTSDVVGWFLVRATVGFFISLGNPFMLSVILDRMKDTAEAMYLREVFFNIGRATGVAVVLACQMLLGSFQYAFIPAGLLLLAYPLLIERKGVCSRGVR